MKKGGNLILLATAITCAFIFASGCKKSDESRPAQIEQAPSMPGAVMQEADRDQPSTAAESGARKGNEKGGPETAAGLPPATARMQTLLQRPMLEADDRFLEYTVDLRYRADDFRRARNTLYEVISKYGFIQSGTTELGAASELTILSSIQSVNLYKFLREIDSIGTLVSERIHVTDLTEQIVLSQRAQRRESIRMERRNRAIGQAGARDRNWQAIENALTISEDRYDGAEHQKWQVTDRVSWAKITIRIEPTGEIKVPPYRKALYWLVETALDTVYAFLYFIPVLVVLLLIWWQWPRISKPFRKKTE